MRTEDPARVRPTGAMSTACECPRSRARRYQDRVATHLASSFDSPASTPRIGFLIEMELQLRAHLPCATHCVGSLRTLCGKSTRQYGRALGFTHTLAVNGRFVGAWWGALRIHPTVRRWRSGPPSQRLRSSCAESAENWSNHAIRTRRRAAAVRT